jgi:hypothetical protein
MVNMKKEGLPVGVGVKPIKENLDARKQMVRDGECYIFEESIKK